MYYPVDVRVTPLTRLRRERLLPLSGEVLVNEGQEVEPSQVVARTYLPGDFHILPVARLLGVSSSKAKKFLRVERGDEVQQGQVIAKRGMLFGRAVKAPIDGVVTASGGGRVLIESQPTLFELQAYVPGEIIQVIEGYGVMIETSGALVQGVWGSGPEGVGVLRTLVKGPDRPLRADMLDPACHGTILVGGRGLDEDVIERAEGLEVSGIVLGGFSADMLPAVEACPLPVVVTDGIEADAMAEPIFDLLSTNEDREAVISGHFETRGKFVRPEVFVPLPAESVPSTETQIGAPLTAGARVRIARAPHLGKIGTVRQIPPHASRTKTGVRARGAIVDIGTEEPVFVPLANLEVIR